MPLSTARASLRATARSPACSDPTAPERRRCCACWRRWSCPMRGSAQVDGLDIVRDRYRVRERIGVLSDARGLYARLTARENVRYYGRLHGLSGPTLETRIDQLIATLGLGRARRPAHAGIFARRAHEGGDRACAGARPDRHCLLDEPTNGLDIMSTRGSARAAARAACRGQVHRVLDARHAGSQRAVRHDRDPRPRAASSPAATARDLLAQSGSRRSRMPSSTCSGPVKALRPDRRRP